MAEANQTEDQKQLSISKIYIKDFNEVMFVCGPTTFFCSLNFEGEFGSFKSVPLMTYDVTKMANK